MGGCSSIDPSISEESERLDGLLEGNLILLRGVMLRTLETKSLAAALKLLKILDLTTSYYEDYQTMRRHMISMGHHISPLDYFTLEKAIQKEKSLADLTRKSLSKTYKVLYKEWTLPGFDTIESRNKDVEASFYYKLNLLKNTFKEIKEKNLTVEDVVLKVNRGIPLTEREEELVKEVCAHTTYMFNKAHNKIKYPQPSRQRHTQNHPSTERIRKIKTTIELSRPRRSRKRENTVPVPNRLQTRIFEFDDQHRNIDL